MNRSVAAEGHSSDKIEWNQLWSLAALYASIVVGWIAYHNYQPKLLEKFHFTDFTFLLMAAQGVILIITPLIAGKLGDKYRFQKGDRIPIISTGISFAAMVFMAVAFTLFTNPNETFRWILPILIICWLIAMSIFTSPALSTLELFTPVDKLPRAMAILTIVANLVYSLEPVIVDLIDFLGAPLTFMAGGVAVFLSGYALKKNSLNLFNSNSSKPRAEIKFDTQKSEIGYIFFLGVALGLSTTILFNYFPEIMHNSLSALLGQMDGKWMLVVVLVISAIASLPISNIINKYGIRQSFWVSFWINLVSMVAMFFFASPILMIALIMIFTISFTSLSVSSLPLAISKANYYEKVFCVGIFFSGVALPDGIIEAIQAF